MLHFLFSFGGRVNRAKFWAFYIGGGVVVELIFVAFITIGSTLSNNIPQLDMLDGRWPQTPIGWATELPEMLLYLAYSYAMIVQLVKRLHDRGKPAWWLAVFWGPTLALFAVIFALRPQAMHQFPMPGAVLLVGLFAAWLIMAWFFIEILFLPGTRGDNRFGPDPRAKKAAN